LTDVISVAPIDRTLAIASLRLEAATVFSPVKRIRNRCRVPLALAVVVVRRVARVRDVLGLAAAVLRTALVRDVVGLAAAVLRTALVRDVVALAAAVLRTARVRVVLGLAAVARRAVVVRARVLAAIVVLARPVVFLVRPLAVRVVRVVEPFARIDDAAFAVGARPRSEAPCRWATR
jgi:hypothetical protein